MIVREHVLSRDWSCVASLDSSTSSNSPLSALLHEHGINVRSLVAILTVLDRESGLDALRHRQVRSLVLRDSASRIDVSDLEMLDV